MWYLQWAYIEFNWVFSDSYVYLAQKTLCSIPLECLWMISTMSSTLSLILYWVFWCTQIWYLCDLDVPAWLVSASIVLFFNSQEKKMPPNQNVPITVLSKLSYTSQPPGQIIFIYLFFKFIFLRGNTSFIVVK